MLVVHYTVSTPLGLTQTPDHELVRLYYPDSPSARAGGVSAETARARFHAITSAYAILKEKKASGRRTHAGDHDLSATTPSGASEFDEFMKEWKGSILPDILMLVRFYYVHAGLSVSYLGSCVG